MLNTKEKQKCLRSFWLSLLKLALRITYLLTVLQVAEEFCDFLPFIIIIQHEYLPICSFEMCSTEAWRRLFIF